MRNEAGVGEAGWLLSDGLGGGGGVRVGMAFFFFFFSPRLVDREEPVIWIL